MHPNIEVMCICIVYVYACVCEELDLHVIVT